MSVVSKVFLGSTFEITHSIIGGNWTNTLPSSVFSTGNYEGSKVINIPLSLNANQGLSLSPFIFPKNASFGLYFKTNGWTLTNTTVSDGNIHSLMDRKTNTTPLIIWRIEPGIGIRVIINDSINPSVIVDCTTCTLLANTFHFASLTYSSDDNVLKAFVDDTLIGSTNATINFSALPSGNLALGSRYWAGDLELDGKMDIFTAENVAKPDFLDRNDKLSGLNWRVE